MKKAHARLLLAAKLRAASVPWLDVASQLRVSYSTATKYPMDPRWDAIYREALNEYVAKTQDSIHAKALARLATNLDHEDPHVTNGAIKAWLPFRAHQEKLVAQLRAKRLERLDKAAESDGDDDEEAVGVIDPTIDEVDTPS